MTRALIFMCILFCACGPTEYHYHKCVALDKARSLEEYDPNGYTVIVRSLQNDCKYVLFPNKEQYSLIKEGDTVQVDFENNTIKR